MILHVQHIIAVGLAILTAVVITEWRTHEDEVLILNSNGSEKLSVQGLMLLQRDSKSKVIAMRQSEHLVPQSVASLNATLTSIVGYIMQPANSSALGPNVTTTGGAASGGASFNLQVFMTGLVTNGVIALICFILFAAASRAYPIMYLGNTIKNGNTPQSVDEFMQGGFFNWAHASWNLTLEDAWEAAGLDHAMLLEYARMGFVTFKWIALPLQLIMGSMNNAFGGHAAGTDTASMYSMGNVEFYSWLYWPTALAVWWVAWCVITMINSGMEQFMPLRYQWLASMDKLRANTVMMIGLPAECQSDEECAKFWNKMFPGSVESVHLVKDTTHIYQLVAEMDDLKLQLRGAEAELAKYPDKRPTIKHSWTGPREDAIDYYKSRIAEKKPQIQAERKLILEKARNIGSPNLPKGFVTFTERKFAEIALRLDLSHDAWFLDFPPEPMDIIWSDMTQDPAVAAGRHLLGYFLIALLVIIYMPLIVLISNVAVLIDLGPLQPIWSAEAPTLGLTIMVDFLPTFLHLIFGFCFPLYDKSHSQLKVSIWYWWMSVLYVVLIAAIGPSFLSFAKYLAKDPLRIFGLLAGTMPGCTHYFMNYISMQFYAHAISLIRHVPLLKYMFFSRVFAEGESKDMAEPEDQDYYGIGARTCRWSVLMCIGIVFGTLSPPLSVFMFGLFFVLRLIYGYLFVYAETVKSDMGGVFFVRALHNTFWSLHIYMITMLGVFCQRSPSWGPVFLVSLAWCYVFLSQRNFMTLRWERLPYRNLDLKPSRKTSHIEGSYVQPELCE